MKIAIIGAGKLGMTLARLSVLAGHETVIYSRPKPMLDLILSTLVPGALLVSFEEAAQTDIVVLAVPRTALISLDLDRIDTLIIDATNPWEATGTGNSINVVQNVHVPLIRTLNHISYEELSTDTRVIQPGPRRAVAVINPGMGEDDAQLDAALKVVTDYVSSLGFTPVVLPATAGVLFEPGGELFGVWLNEQSMKERSGY